MTVDLEDYYCDLPLFTWGNYEERVVETTRIILGLFEKYKVEATFFTLGYIAEKHPDLIEEVRSRGHEIASHSYSHPNIRHMTKEDFEKDLVKSLDILKKVSGDKVLGFRAPYFSINKLNLWAFDVIKKHVRYDSSLFPVRFHYDCEEAPRHIYRMSDNNPLEQNDTGEFIELPMTTLRLPIIGNLPVAGGLYLRLLPYSLLRFGIEKINKAGYPAIFYIHPKDLDRALPRLPGNPWHIYWGLNGSTKKFESILMNFRFSSVRQFMSL